MSENQSPYTNLPYLDNIHQKICTNGYVTKLKTPLRNAVNANRDNPNGMRELIDMLEDTLVFIRQNDKPKKKRTYKKKTEPEYDLP